MWRCGEVPSGSAVWSWQQNRECGGDSNLDGNGKEEMHTERCRDEGRGKTEREAKGGSLVLDDHLKCRWKGRDWEG